MSGGASWPWRVLAAALLAFPGSGCLKPYLAPGPEAPAALVKVRLAYDHARVAALLPPQAHGSALEVQVTARDARGVGVLASRRWAELPRLPAPVPLETLAASLVAGGPVTLEVRLAVVWMVTTTEVFQVAPLNTRQVMVQVPRQVMRQEPYLDPVSGTGRTRTLLSTELSLEPRADTESRPVSRAVTWSYVLGCAAEVTLTPAAGALYLVDYANLAVGEGCSALGYRQRLRDEHTFELLPLELPAG
jgi:hypothetical protein